MEKFIMSHGGTIGTIKDAGKWGFYLILGDKGIGTVKHTAAKNTHSNIINETDLYKLVLNVRDTATFFKNLALSK